MCISYNVECDMCGGNTRYSVDETPLIKHENLILEFDSKANVTICNKCIKQLKQEELEIELVDRLSEFLSDFYQLNFSK